MGYMNNFFNGKLTDRNSREQVQLASPLQYKGGHVSHDFCTPVEVRQLVSGGIPKVSEELCGKFLAEGLSRTDPEFEVLQRPFGGFQGEVHEDGAKERRNQH